MNENRLPNFDSVEELIDFFDTHDMGKYMDAMPEVQFDVALKENTVLVEVDQELMKKLAKLAKKQKTSTFELINSWLEEKVAQAA